MWNLHNQCRLYGGRPSDRLRQRDFPGWGILRDDFDSAVAGFATWVEERRAETVPVGRGRKGRTKRKYSDEMIFGTEPRGINNPVDFGPGRFGEVPMLD